MGGGKTTNNAGGLPSLASLRNKRPALRSVQLVSGAELRRSLQLPPELDALVSELQSPGAGKDDYWWEQSKAMIAALDQQQLADGLPYHLSTEQVFFLFTDRVLIFPVNDRGQAVVSRRVGLAGPPRPGQLVNCAVECQIAAILCSRYSGTQHLSQSYQNLAEFYHQAAEQRGQVNSLKLPEIPEW